MLPHTTFWIEENIKGCFDNTPHVKIINGTSKKIGYPATLNIVKKIQSSG